MILDVALYLAVTAVQVAFVPLRAWRWLMRVEIGGG